MKKPHNINEMFQRYIRNECTSEEIFFLFHYFDIEENEAVLKELIHTELDKSVKGTAYETDKAHLDRVYNKINTAIDEKETVIYHKKDYFYSLIKIAATLIFVSIGAFIAYTYFVDRFLITSDELVDVAQRNELQPGGNKAVLTLHNGTQIILNDIKEGEVINEMGMVVSKSSEGRVVYKTDSLKPIDSSFEPSLNTISTPRGGEYEIVLADGTRVWLNAASSLTFPTTFSEKNRKVKLKGEAYFEVAHDKTKPFFVETPQNEVEVLGTHFNIMEYPEEDISQTTLLEGSVRVRHGANEKLLKPGQQAEVKKESLDIAVRSVDLEKTIAWKNGIFLFDREGIDQVMHQIARWYNADVVYEGKKPSDVLNGMVSRKDSLKGLLDILETAGGIKFNIQGNKIIVHNQNLNNMKK